MLRKDFNVKIPIKTVLDPTLLVDSKEYINLINNYGKFQIPSKAYLFCYILDNTEEKQNIIQKIRIDMGVENVYLSAQSSSLLEKEPIRPIEEWLAYIQNSKFVITDSYHGMLFSIIFRKPFLVYGNQNRGIERFTSILNKLGLTSRLITSYSEFNNEILYNNIDWRLVYNQLNFLQQESLSFLHSTLNSIRS